MLGLQTILFVSLTAALVAWLTVSLHVLIVERRRATSRDTVAAAIRVLQQDEIRTLALDDRVSRITPLLARASRALVMRAAADPETPKPIFDGFAGYLTGRWGIDSLVGDATSHRSAREKWRRMAALKILFRLNHPSIVRLLDHAVAGTDAEVASVALTLLGQSSDPGAIDVLLVALRSQRHSPARVAAHLEWSPQDFGDRLRPLLQDHSPDMRFWSATLLGRFAYLNGLEAELAPLTDDADPRVRKAAVTSLGKVGNQMAAAAALRLLLDPEPFVRAQAARALGDLNRSDLADDVAMLLSDRNWWVRRAAMDSLEAMGNDVWPVLVRCLDHTDAFVRNAAAEVFQNLGVLDSLIIMEAATDNPSASKIEMLQRITAAGGGRLTDSLIERAGPAVRPRVRQLLATIGLQRVAV